MRDRPILNPSSCMAPSLSDSGKLPDRWRMYDHTMDYQQEIRRDAPNRYKRAPQAVIVFVSVETLDDEDLMGNLKVMLSTFVERMGSAEGSGVISWSGLGTPCLQATSPKSHQVHSSSTIANVRVRVWDRVTTDACCLLPGPRSRCYG